MNPEQDPYYGRPECSNSDLSFLNKYWQSFQISYDVEKVQNFGTLLDCMITEPGRVNYFRLTCAGVQYTQAEFDLAEAMKRSFQADELCRILQQQSDLQKITVDDGFEIEYLGFRFRMPFRMKADFNAKRILRMIADLKSTAATSLKAFVEAIRAFQYHRQGALYMDMEGVDKFMLIGVGKTAPHPIFKVAMERGDALYCEGKALYEELAFRHFNLFHDLRIEYPRIAA